MNRQRSQYLLIGSAIAGPGDSTDDHRHFVSTLARVDPDAVGTLLTCDGRAKGWMPEGFAARRTPTRLRLAFRAILATSVARPTEIIVFHISLVWLAWLVARLSRARLTVITKDWALPTTPRRICRLLGARADRMVVHSRYTAEAADHFFYPWVPRRFADILIFPPTFDSEQFVPDPDARERFRLANQISDDDIVLLTVSRLDPTEQGKGHDRVIRALPALLVDEPHLVYLIMGEGDDESRLRALTHQLGLGGHVHFVGFCEDPPACYAGADLFVMPSTQEGFDIVFVESMACGRPVVAGGVDGSISAVLFGEVGFLCDPYDPASLRHAIRSALTGLREGDPRADPKIIRTRAIEEFGPSAFDARLRELLDS